jgi:hypothetical protein
MSGERNMGEERESIEIDGVSVVRDSRVAGSAHMFRPEWTEIEVPEGHVLSPIYYHEALGVLAARFNTTEIYFRGLVGLWARWPG